MEKFTFHYASTLSDDLPDPEPLESVFTFHYASTLSGLTGQVYVTQTNLHSTMLLLYPVSGTIFPSNANGFTFHYASTLSLAALFAKLKNNGFTFHYASTLSFK